MSQQPSVCIVGAGAVGLATAVHLTRRGVTDVTVLEADHIAAGSSGLSVGIIETQYVTPLDIELRVRAMGFFADLERDHGLHVTRNGYLRLAHSAEQLESFERSVEIQRSLGVADARVLDAAGVGRLVPEMRVDDVDGGLFGPGDGFIDGHLYCALLGELLEAQGVRLLARHKVEEIESPPGGGHLVRTSRGEFRCDYVVNAAGAWGDHVARAAGMEMPLAPQRHEAIVVHLEQALPYVVPSVMDYTPHSGETGLYFRHERAGQMIAGLHSEEATEGVADPDDYARSARPDFIEEVAEKIASRLPGVGDPGLAHGWAGLYPVSPDGVPQVGPSPGSDTIIVAGGAGGSGIQLSPVMGELAADWILHGEPRSIGDGGRLSPRRASLRTAAETA
ncbi:NAD(P)/FAD-dependent oxidoreductase [Conexibacter arvalis]|uniref:Sarcosine oxidase subunit beta n=1 Tax=Conexibacter arvalis TaxID=912552 RepID=A0A840IAZ9_9ACTN|nr:FAD-dependent oxidoreductase [Conexibacter arvalis]MBB4662006.1 sarcosine oxidase subunit beta [Conexibacter arvalis]